MAERPANTQRGALGLELAGIAAVTAGAALVHAALGLAVLGLCLILLGLAAERAR
jgi:hypothetical protein